MKDLIKIEVNENQEPVVNGRELYEALGIQTRYDTWFNRMKEYGFAKNIDYVEINEKVDAQKRARTYEQVNHAIKEYFNGFVRAYKIGLLLRISTKTQYLY